MNARGLPVSVADLEAELVLPDVVSVLEDDQNVVACTTPWHHNKIYLWWARSKEMVRCSACLHASRGAK